MKSLLPLCLTLAVGVAIGRMLDGVSPAAAAPAGLGDGADKCATKNGDVNADGGIDVSDAITILRSLFLGDPAELVPLCQTEGAPAGLLDTGQSKCYDLTGTGEEIPCNSETCPGQDGFYATGCPSEGRFTDNGDGTVSGRCTGLMWQKDTADTNGDGQSTDKDFLPWCDALAYCENLSFGGGLGAWDDWRLPNVRELQSLIDYGRISPAVHPVFYSLSYNYWSSSSYFNILPAGAWRVRFEDGAVDFDVKGNDYYVRAVRSGR